MRPRCKSGLVIKKLATRKTSVGEWITTRYTCNSNCGWGGRNIEKLHIPNGHRDMTGEREEIKENLAVMET